MARKDLNKKSELSKPVTRRKITKREREQLPSLRLELFDVKERLKDVRSRLEEAEMALNEIRTGTVDALLIQTEEGEKVFTLRGAEHPYRLFVQNMSEGAATLSTEGTILFSNERLAEILNIPLEKLMGSEIWKYLPTRSQMTLKSLLPPQTGMRTNGELDMMRPDGSSIPVAISITNMNIHPGVRVHCIVLRDISAPKKAEQAILRKAEELARSNQDLEQFAYVASHDLREPLRMISSYLELFRLRYCENLDEKGSKYMQYIFEGVERMNMIINDLLDYSRAGSAQFPAERVNSEEILNVTLKNLDHFIKENHAQITHDSLPPVYLHPAQLRTVLQNLIENAIKFHGEQPPEVRIQAKLENGNAIFSVKDNGIGISPQYYNRIFMLFQRLHPRSKYSGTGIGLAVCKKIIERAGGEIWVDSDLGKGSTFYFKVPLTKPPSN